MKRFSQTFVFAVCLLFSAAALYNVYSDNAEVERMAGAVACGDAAGCTPHMTRLTRSPFGQTFEFSTPKRTVGVRCARALLLVGEYACKLE